MQHVQRRIMLRLRLERGIVQIAPVVGEPDEDPRRRDLTREAGLGDGPALVAVPEAVREPRAAQQTPDALLLDELQRFVVELVADLSAM